MKISFAFLLIGTSFIFSMTVEMVDKKYKDLTKELKEKRLDIVKELSTQRNDLLKANQGIQQQQTKLKKIRSDKKTLETQIEIIKEQIKKIAAQETASLEELKKSSAQANKISIAALASLPNKQQAGKNSIEKLDAFNKEAESQTTIASSRDVLKKQQAPAVNESKLLQATLNDVDKFLADAKKVQANS